MQNYLSSSGLKDQLDIWTYPGLEIGWRNSINFGGLGKASTH